MRAGLPFPGQRPGVARLGEEDDVRAPDEEARERLGDGGAHVVLDPFVARARPPRRRLDHQHERPLAQHRDRVADPADGDGPAGDARVQDVVLADRPPEPGRGQRELGGRGERGLHVRQRPELELGSRGELDAHEIVGAVLRPEARRGERQLRQVPQMLDEVAMPELVQPHVAGVIEVVRDERQQEVAPLDRRRLGGRRHGWLGGGADCAHPRGSGHPTDSCQGPSFKGNVLSGRPSSGERCASRGPWPPARAASACAPGRRAGPAPPPGRPAPRRRRTAGSGTARWARGPRSGGC